jgi:sugar (pentulose or hexulose) kinase
MTMTVDVGVDLGTTVTKAVALDGARRVVARASLPTPWERPRAEWCERDPADAVTTVDRLLADLVRVAGDVQVRSIGFCSIAETGALVDPDGRAVSRLLAWHDPRGGHQAAGLDPGLAGMLPSRTGLAISSVATVFKLLWWREEAGLDLRGLQWLGLAELVCHGLGAGRFAERSMLGRTALWDIHDEALFEPALEVLDAGPDLVPPRVAAGAALGRVRADHPVEQARGAVLTVAGHDHLVAAAALGAGGVGSLCDSMGTAEALVAAVGAPPPPLVVAGLVSRGLSVYPHVVDSTTCLLGALRTGLVLGRALDNLGATTIEQRLAFDARAPSGTIAADVTVEGLDMADDHVTVAWPDGTDPYAAWAGVLGRTREVVASEVAAMRAVGVPVDEVVVTGGWAHLPSVAASRRGIAARTHHVTMEEPGTTGAALFARWAATRHPEGSDPTGHDAPQAGWFTDPPI